MGTVQFIIYGLIYLAAAYVVLLHAPGRLRICLFALVNILGVWRLLYLSENFLDPRWIAVYAAYILLVVLQYVMLALFAEGKGWRPWLAFFTPLIALILIKYALPVLCSRLAGKQLASLQTYYFIGISYLAFRASHLVLEVRNGMVKRPGFWEYLGFSFFLPTMSVGPINSYTQFVRGFSAPDRAELPVGRCLLRILVGFTKFIFLASLAYQLSYDSLVLDGHPHHWSDLVIAAVFYYLFLYCNFSGFCDIAIGTAGLLGFPVEENFRDPFSARNLQEFWNRWHITLSRYMRDVVFTPLSKWLIGLFGIAFANVAIAISIFVVFLLVGIWHGVGWNYAAFGAAHGLGLVIVHYYGIYLKKWLGKEGYKRYLQNPIVKGISVTLTFAYVAACLFIFANDFPTMRKIISAIS